MLISVQQHVRATMEYRLVKRCMRQDAAWPTHGHHVARVVALFAVLQTCDHPALFGPGLCGIDKLPMLALFETGLLRTLLHGKFQEFGDALHRRVTRQANDVVDTGAFAVVDDALPAKAQAATQDDAHLVQAFGQQFETDGGVAGATLNNRR